MFGKPSISKIFQSMLLGSVSVIGLTAHAQIVSDGTAGAAQAFTGPNYTIDQSDGTTSGTNLLHSFSDFNVGVGESATFTGDAALENIIARVTGGNISLIEGLLSVQAANADFFLVNPAGVTITDTAVIDVPAALFITTADEIGFEDGSTLSASATPVSGLSTESISSFGFLGGGIGQISIDGMNGFAEGAIGIVGSDVSITDTTVTMNVDPFSGNYPISVIAAVGTDTVTLGFDPSGTTAEEVLAPVLAYSPTSGTLTMDNSFVEGSLAGLGLYSAFAGGTMNFSNYEWTRVGGVDGTPHNLFFTGGDLNFNNFRAYAVRLGSPSLYVNDAVNGKFVVDIDGKLTLIDGYFWMGGSRAESGGGDFYQYKPYDVIFSVGEFEARDTYFFQGSENRTDDVQFNSGSFSLMSDGDVLFANTDIYVNSRSGSAGDISIESGGQLTFNNTDVWAYTSGDSDSESGDVSLVSASGVTLTNSFFGLGVRSGVSANAGSFTLDAGGNVTFSNTTVNNSHQGTGAAGDISVSAGGSLSLVSSWLNGEHNNFGDGGNLMLSSVGDLLLDSSTFYSTAFSGNAGNMSFSSTTGNLTIASSDFDMLSSGDTLDAGDLTLSAVDVVVSNTRFDGYSATGWGSDVSVMASGNASFTDVTFNSYASGAENAGFVSISSGGSVNATNLSMNTQNSGTGAGGDVTLVANDDVIVSGGNTNASTNSTTARAGNVSVFAGRDISFSGQHYANTSSELLDGSGAVLLDAGRDLSLDETNFETQGNGAGDITLHALRDISILNGTALEAGAFGSGADPFSGDGGDIIVTAGGNVLIDDSQLEAETGSTGNAGEVNITAGGDITVDEFRIVTYSILDDGSGEIGGDGGDISLASYGGNIFLGDGELGSYAFSFNNMVGAAGDISVTAAGDISLNGNGYVYADALNGTATGNINVAATGNLDIFGYDIAAWSDSGASTGEVALSAGQALTMQDTLVSTFIESDIWARLDGDESGTAGTVRVTADSLTMTNSGLVASTTTGADAGQVIVDVAGNVAIQGNYGEYDFYDSDGNPAPLNFSAIEATTIGAGNAGNVDITAGSLTIQNATFDTQTVTTGDAGDISISTTGDVTANGYTMNASTTLSDGSGSVGGSAGNVTILADGNVTLGSGGIEANAFSAGSANLLGGSGSIIVQAGGNIDLNGLGWIYADSFNSTVSSGVDLFANGTLTATDYMITADAGGNVDAGAVSLTSLGDMSLTDTEVHAMVFSGFDAVQSGNAGSVIVNADNLTLTNTILGANSQIGSNGGTVEITSEGDLLVSGNNGTHAINVSSNGAGNAGSVTVLTYGDSASFSDGALVNASSAGTGDGGNLLVQSAGTLALENAVFNVSGQGGGNAGSISTFSSGLTSLDGSTLDGRALSDPAASGMGGTLTIDAGSLSSVNDSQISTSTTTAGNGGTVTLDIDGDLTLDGNSWVSSESFAGGDSGTVTATVGGATLFTSGGGIRTAAHGTGSAGDVELTTGDLTIDGTGGDFTALWTAGLNDSANGGDITVTATGDVLLTNGGALNARSNGVGRAGDQTITVGGTLTLSNGGYILTRSGTVAGSEAGNIFLDVGSLQMDGGSDPFNTVIRADSLSQGEAGNIRITASGDIVMQNGALIYSNASGAGTAGAIHIAAENLSIFDRSSISTNGGTLGLLSFEIADTFLIDSGDNDGYYAVSMFGSEGSAPTRDAEWQAPNGASDGVYIEAGNLIVTSTVTGFPAVGFYLYDFSGGALQQVYFDIENDLTFENARLYSYGSENLVDIDVGGAISFDNSEIALSSNGETIGTLDVTADSFSAVNGSDFDLIGFTNSFGQDVAGGTANFDITGDAMFDFTDIDVYSSGGDAGKINMNVGGTLTLQNTSVFDARSDGFNLYEDLDGDGVAETASLFRAGDGGEVNISAGAVELINGGIIAVSALNGGSAGSINITDTGSLLVSGASSVIDASEVNSDAAGTINIEADEINIVDGGQITAHVYGGEGGDITVQAKTLNISGVGTLDLQSFDGNRYIVPTSRHSGIFMNANGALSQGSLKVLAGELTLEEGGRIGSSTVGGGAGAANIDIRAGQLDIFGPQSGVYSSAPGLGTISLNELAVLYGFASPDELLEVLVQNGSYIDDDPAYIVYVLNSVSPSGVMLTVDDLPYSGSMETDAGDITIGASALSVEEGFIQTSGTGNGGTIRIGVDTTAEFENAVITTDIAGQSPQDDTGDIFIGTSLAGIDTGSDFDPFSETVAPLEADGLPETFVNETGELDAFQEGEVYITTNVIVPIEAAAAAPEPPEEEQEASEAAEDPEDTFTPPEFALGTENAQVSLCAAESTQSAGGSSLSEVPSGRIAKNPTTTRPSTYSDLVSEDAQIAACYRENQG